MRVKNIGRAADHTGIPEERLEAHEQGILQLSDDELYATALALRCHPLSLLDESDRDQLWNSGLVTRREISQVDEVSDITTELGIQRIMGTYATSKTLTEITNSAHHEYNENDFIHFECASGVTHLIRFGAIKRVHVRENIDRPPPPEFNPQFQLAITDGVKALGSDHPMTSEVKKNRSTILVAMQRPIEKAVMEVRLNNGKTLYCRLTTDWRHDPSVELFYEIIHNLGIASHFLCIPLTPDYEEDRQFVKANDITSLTVPSEHLARYTNPTDSIDL